jgi:hypothetical protein
MLFGVQNDKCIEYLQPFYLPHFIILANMETCLDVPAGLAYKTIILQSSHEKI